jgi:hypothetical protein
VGNVVLLKDKTATSCTYKLARAMEVIPGVKDNIVRKVMVSHLKGF